MTSFHDVSVVIASFGHSVNLERCVRSCVSQTFPGRSLEVLILHDSEGLVVQDVLANYAVRGAVEAHLTVNDSAAVFNSAIRNSTGRFIVFVDSDDFISDFMILCQTIFLYDNPAFDGVRSDYWLIEDGSDRKLSRVDGHAEPVFEGTMLRKDVLVRVARGESPAVGYEPEKLRAVLGKKTSIGHLPISFYRKNSRRARAALGVQSA
jgi:glycosyltransferase involved in cell wall biosynthesis